MSFFEELKRRKVFRVAATYAIVAWILMQIGEVTFPALNIPEWVMSTLVVVLLAGFPIAVIFAWVFDKTPQGYIKTDAQDTEDIVGMNVKVDGRPFYLQKRNIFLALGVIAGILIGTYGGSALSNNNEDDKSIAVLPFDNFSKDKDDEYLSNGITEDITMNLAKVKELTVISRTSVMKYKGSMKNAKEIAEELSVKYILEGSIRKIGERVRIVGQLIDAVNDKHIWSDSYDRNMVDIFDIQADVSKEIANAMEAELTEKTIANIESVPTNNMEAYILYQRARSYYGMYTMDGNETSINLLNDALVIDENYALAYAGLADSYAQRVIRFKYDESWMDSALIVADLALGIDPNLAEAYKAKGLVYMGSSLLMLAEENTDKALEINPGFHTAVANKGILLSRRGLLFEAQEYLTKSTRLNPTSTSTESIQLAQIYNIIGQYERAHELIFDAIKNSPNVRASYARGIEMMLSQGLNEKAKSIIDLFQNNKGNIDDLNFFKGQLSFYNKDYEKALKYFNTSGAIARRWRGGGFSDFSNAHYLLKTLIKLNKSFSELLNAGIVYNNSKLANEVDAPTMYLQLSVLHSFNNQNKSLEYLEKAVKRGFRNKTLLEDSVFDSIRNNDRFKLVLSEVDIFIQREKLKFNKAGLISNS
jgi:TolB-like protein/Tfp pilus assembly protein PilF